MNPSILFALVLLLCEGGLINASRRPNPIKVFYDSLGITMGCQIEYATERLQQEGCIAKDIQRPYCAGYCPSRSVYTDAFPHYKLHCSCCKATKMTMKYYLIECPSEKVEGENESKLVGREVVAECSCLRVCQNQKNAN